MPAAALAEDEPKLRFGFVEMLFALTAGEIAVEAADLVKHIGVTVGGLPAYAHLLFATALVTTSWVGWLRSKAPGNRLDVATVFSAPFFVLLLDVFLVVCYFIIVRGVDIERTRDDVYQLTPSSANETLWLMVVFIGYFSWDVLTKAVLGYQEEKDKTFLQRIAGVRFWKRSWSSLTCCLLAITAWLFLGQFTQPFVVTLVDGALIALVFLFRALKQGTWTWAGTMFALFLAATGAGIRLGR